MMPGPITHAEVYEEVKRARDLGYDRLADMADAYHQQVCEDCDTRGDWCPTHLPDLDEDERGWCG